MRAILNWLESANVGVLSVILLVFLGLLAGGANTAAGASAYSAALLVALAIAAFIARRGEVRRAITENALTLIGALGFIALALITSRVELLEEGAGAIRPWAFAAIASPPQSISPYRTLEGVVAFLAPCAAFLLGAIVTHDRSGRDWAGRWIIACAAIFSLAALGLFFAGGGIDAQRLDAGLSSANAAAALFGMLFLIAAALVVRAARGRLGHDHENLPAAWSWAAPALRAPLSFAAMLLFFACILLTASRGGLIAGAAGLIVFAAALIAQTATKGRLRGGLALTPVLLMVTLFAVLFARGGEDVLRRFALASEDMEIRRVLAEAHWAQFQSQPIFGHGLNTYHELNVLAASPENWNALRDPGSVHNIVIQALEETGLVGLGLWILMLATPIARLIVRMTSSRHGVEWAAAGFAVTVLLFSHGLVDFALQVPAIAALYAFMLGAIAGRSEASPQGAI